jgi:S1-C subfamily serine protease
MMSEPPSSLEYIVARVADVQGDQSGSTWAFASLISSTLAVTAWHAIKGPSTGQSAEKKLLLDFAAAPQRFTVPATVIADDDDFDFAVLRLDSAVPWELPSPLLSSQVPPEGAPWECFYFVPLEQLTARAFGRVEGLDSAFGDRRLLRLAILTAPGDPTGPSGAPVVVEGQVVGIVQAGSEQRNCLAGRPFRRDGAQHGHDRGS